MRHYLKFLRPFSVFWALKDMGFNTQTSMKLVEKYERYFYRYMPLV